MWFQWKGQGQIQGQIWKIVQKRQIALLSFVIVPNFTEMGRIIMHQSKLQCIGFNYVEWKFDYVVFPWWYSRWRLGTHCQNIRKYYFPKFWLLFFGIVVIKVPQAKLYSNKLIKHLCILHQGTSAYIFVSYKTQDGVQNGRNM